MTAETLELVGIGRGDDDDSVREVVESFMVEAAEVHGVKEFVVVADVVFERVGIGQLVEAPSQETS